MNRVKRCFLDADLRCSQPGLRQLAKAEGCNPDRLQKGEHIIFINTAQTKLKMLSANNTLLYLALPKGRIDLDTIKYLPSVYGESLTVKYKESVKKVLIDRLKPKR